MADNHEKVTVIVMPRDRFSCTFECLAALEENTPKDLYDLVIVMGGAPALIRKRLELLYRGKAKMIFEERYLNGPQMRNRALRETETRLAVIVENDVFVQKGWLEAMIQCQTETGAAMVSPLILEHDNGIHTAGNDLYVTYKNGKAYGHKELRYHRLHYAEGSNLERRDTTYGELHCQLVITQVALDLGVYDENIVEIGECDSGLTWSKNGYKMMFEPKAVVQYVTPDPGPIEAEDVRYFVWRWDMRHVLQGFKYFEMKWDIDITEYGYFRNFMDVYNAKVGVFLRIYPYSFAVKLNKVCKHIRKMVVGVVMYPKSLLWHVRAKYQGYYEWPVPE